MRKYLNQYISEFEKSLNVNLMNKTSDLPLVEYVIDSWKSLEVVPNIKFVGYEYTEEESTIDINKYIFKREKKKKKKERCDYKFIDDDRYGKLTVHLEISILEENKDTKEKFVHKYPLKKDMLIPLQDEDGYFFIKGKKYYLIYQMVEKSTYTSSSSITLKSLMPIAIKRTPVHVMSVGFDEDEEENKLYTVPSYSVFVFKKEIPVILFYLSKGLDFTLSFLEVDNIISIISQLPDKRKKGMLYFQLSNKCYIEVNKELFDKYPYVQSIIGGLSTITTNRCSIEQLNDTKTWIKKISGKNSYEKGLDILKFFNRMLDETTKKILKIHPRHVENIYTLLRWMMEEFNTLRLKDNMALENKRLRCNEYVASLLTKEFSKRLYRIISLGDKATIENFKELIKFSGDILLLKMHSSGVLRYDDNVNDMNFLSKFKYTTKGPHSLGAKNQNNISIKYRGLHPSYIGNIDCLVCGNSDPGTSGTLSPFSKIQGLYFDNSNEPDDFLFNLQSDLEKISKENNELFIKLSFDNKDDYLNCINKLEKLNNENIAIYGTSRTDNMEIIIENGKE